MRNNDGTFAKKEQNEVEYFGEYAVIWTTDKEGNRKTPYKVDLDDVERLLKYRWSVGTGGYAKHRSLKMHRLIMNAQKGQIVDHINQDVTDNRKSNLRFVTHSENMRNSSKTKAKSGHKHIRINPGGTFAVEFKCNGEKYYNGNIPTLEEALKKRNEMYEGVGYIV